MRATALKKTHSHVEITLGSNGKGGGEIHWANEKETKLMIAMILN